MVAFPAGREKQLATAGTAGWAVQALGHLETCVAILCLAAGCSFSPEACTISEEQAVHQTHPHSHLPQDPSYPSSTHHTGAISAHGGVD